MLVEKFIVPAYRYYAFDDFTNAAVLELLTPTEKYKFKKIVDDIKYMPLLKALKLSYTNESGILINEASSKFIRDLFITKDKQAQEDSFYIRRSALQSKVFYVTTLGAADTVCKSYNIQLPFEVYKGQDLHGQAKSIDAVP